MRTMLLCLAALVSTSTHAADIAEQESTTPDVADVVPISAWDGAYIGALGGISWLDEEYGFRVAAGPASVRTITPSRKTTGGLLGAFAGYNFQLSNNVVLGAEGDFSYNWNHGKVSLKSYGLPIAPDVGVDWSGSIRARVGYAFDDALVYGAVGWTTARGFVDTPIDSGSAKIRKSLNGYTLGAGVDYRLNRNIFVRAEYRFNDYGSEKIGGTTFDDKQHQMIFGLGYKF